MTTKAIRVTAHNSRKGNPDHNDRSFDISKADNIDPTRCHENLYWTCFCFEPFTHAEREKLLMRDDDYIHRFSAAEMMFYQSNFGEFLDARNEKRRKQRNDPTSMEEYWQSRNSKPEETLYYLGDMNGHAKKEDIQAILGEFFEWHERRFPLARFLNWSLHCDEIGAPHVHLRKVWTAHDKEGRLYVGQDASLREMGVEPSGTGKKARYNNRKITYTREALEKLQEIAAAHGYTVELQPREKSKSGRSRDEYIAEKKREEAAIAEAAAKEAEAKAATARVAERHATAAVVALTRQQQERLQAVSAALDSLDATRWTAALTTLDNALKGFTMKPSTTEAKTNAKAAREAVEGIAETLEALRAFVTSAGETTEQAKAYADMQRRLTRTRNAISRAEKKLNETKEASERLAAQAEADRAEQWQNFLQEMQRTLEEARAKQQAEIDEKNAEIDEKKKALNDRERDLDKEADRRADERVREHMTRLHDEESTLQSQISTHKTTLNDLQTQIATAQRQITPITTALCATHSVDELQRAAKAINDARNTTWGNADEKTIVQEIAKAREHRGRNNSYSSPEY